MAKYIADNNKVLLAKLRKDITSHLPLLVGKVAVTRFDSILIPDFLEFMYPIRFAVFSLG